MNIRAITSKLESGTKIFSNPTPYRVYCIRNAIYHLDDNNHELKTIQMSSVNHTYLPRVLDRHSVTLSIYHLYKRQYENTLNRLKQYAIQEQMY